VNVGCAAGVQDKTHRYFHPMFKVELFLQVVGVTPEEFTARTLASTSREA
jgi:hypothetical protein